MSLDIGQAFGRSIDRTASRVGGILAAALFAVQLATTTAMRTMLAGVVPQETLQTVPGVTLPGGATAGAVLFLVAWLVTLALYVVVARIGVAGRTDTVPEEVYSRRMGPAMAHLFVASLVIFVLVGIGTVLLLVPGIFLAVSFAFALFYVAVEDDGAIDAMKNSWNLASGNRLRIFLLVLLVAVVAGLPSSFVTTLIGTSIVGWVVSSVVSAVTYIYALFVMADAYSQLRDGQGGDGVDTDPAATPA